MIPSNPQSISGIFQFETQHHQIVCSVAISFFKTHNVFDCKCHFMHNKTMKVGHLFFCQFANQVQCIQMIIKCGSLLNHQSIAHLTNAKMQNCMKKNGKHPLNCEKKVEIKTSFPINISARVNPADHKL